MNIFKSAINRLIAKIYRRKITKLVMKIDREDILAEIYSEVLKLTKEE